MHYSRSFSLSNSNGAAKVSVSFLFSFFSVCTLRLFSTFFYFPIVCEKFMTSSFSLLPTLCSPYVLSVHLLCVCLYNVNGLQNENKSAELPLTRFSWRHKFSNTAESIRTENLYTEISILFLVLRTLTFILQLCSAK
jgi:hypothetical protein